jgi:hypothetical protein
MEASISLGAIEQAKRVLAEHAHIGVSAASLGYPTAPRAQSRLSDVAAGSYPSRSILCSACC